MKVHLVLPCTRFVKSIYYFDPSAYCKCNVIFSHSQEAYKLRADTFGYRKNNLLVAIAEEDLAYILYVKQYMSGLFDEAM